MTSAPILLLFPKTFPIFAVVLIDNVPRRRRLLPRDPLCGMISKVVPWGVELLIVEGRQ